MGGCSGKGASKPTSAPGSLSGVIIRQLYLMPSCKLRTSKDAMGQSRWDVIKQVHGIVFFITAERIRHAMGDALDADELAELAIWATVNRQTVNSVGPEVVSALKQCWP